MIFMILWFAVALVLIVIEYFLATKLRSPLWGGIPPLLAVGVTIYLYMTQSMDMQGLIPYLIVVVLLFGEWSSGRRAYLELQQDNADKK